jgi:hypothetical protein
MQKLLVCFVVLFSALAQAEVSKPLLDSFQNFATRDLVMFGAPKTTVLNFTESLQGYFVQAGGTILGNAIAYERCLAQLEGEDIRLKCYDGLSAALDVCKTDPSVCQKEGVKLKLRELSLDPDLASGQTMRGIGQQTVNPSMRSLTALAKEYPAARKALAQAMSLNGCTSVELGDIAGQTAYLSAQALADDETYKVYEGAQNRWRATMKCRSASASVYVDVVSSVEGGKIYLRLVPVKAVESPGVLINVEEPNLGPKS